MLPDYSTYDQAIGRPQTMRAAYDALDAGKGFDELLPREPVATGVGDRSARRDDVDGRQRILRAQRGFQ